MTEQDKPKRGKTKADAAPADTGGSANESGRIAKILARAGVASRRDVERMVAEGRVKVNGKTYNGFMQGYAEKLDDAEVAMIATYVNTRWGNKGASITSTQVAARRGAKGLAPKPAGPAAQRPELALRTGAITARPCAMCHGETIPAGDDPAKLLSVISVENKAKPHPLMGQSMTLHQLTGLLVHADPDHGYLTPQQTITWLRGL